MPRFLPTKAYWSFQLVKRFLRSSLRLIQPYLYLPVNLVNEIHVFTVCVENFSYEGSLVTSSSPRVCQPIKVATIKVSVLTARRAVSADQGTRRHVEGRVGGCHRAVALVRHATRHVVMDKSTWRVVRRYTNRLTNLLLRPVMPQVWP